MKAIESSGATREEAIQRGLKELGVDLHEVDHIDVIDEGSKGFLGLGKRPVRVRLSLDRAPSRESKQRDSGPDRRHPKQQQQNRPDRNASHPREKAKTKEQPRKNDSRKNGSRPAAAPQGKHGHDSRGGDNRGGGRENHGGGKQDQKQDRNRDRGRDKNRPHKGNAPQHNANQKARSGAAPVKAAPITGKSASNVTEESMEAQRLADQFETIDLNASTETQAPSLPPNAHEEENIEPITDEQGNEASALLQQVINHMDLTAKVSFVRAKDGSARLAVESEEDGGILIGKRGITLEALQYLINRIVPQSGGNENTERVVVDVGDYVDRRHAMLRDMAIAMADQAKSSGRNVRLKPLSPQERRIIHLTLEKDPQVRTYSTGDSLFRSVIINPVGERRPDNHRRGDAGRKKENHVHRESRGE